MHEYRWKSKNNGPVLLKWLFYRTETVNKCVWLRLARMEMDSNLKTSGRLFQVFAHASDKSATTEFGYSETSIKRTPSGPFQVSA